MSNKPPPVPALLSSRVKCPICAARLKEDDFDHARIKRRIAKAGYEVFRVTPLLTGLGMQYFLIGGGVVTLYNTGSIDVGGKMSAGKAERLKRKLKKQRK